MPGTIKIPGYKLLAKLGSGTSGTVYKARQISMDRMVALKILPRDASRDRRFIERFTREARAVARLNHSNVVAGIDVGEAGGIHYFVMEYVDGESAASRITSQGKVGEKEALEITRQVALALDHAYRNGIVHRDIKPANILVTLNGVAKLADLGVARQAGGEGGGGRVFGTPYYMSPEQARGESDIDTRSDIYSLGATLYHMLCGQPPFHGDPPAIVMAKQIAAEPEDARELNPSVSRAAGDLVRHMMAKSRDERPETPTDLVAGIDRALKGRAAPAPGASGPGPTRPRPLGRGGARERAARRPRHAVARGAEAEARAHVGGHGALVAVVLALVVLLGAGVWLMLGSGAGNGGYDTDPRTVTPPGTTPVPPPAPAGLPPAPADDETVAREALSALLKEKLPPGARRAALLDIEQKHPGTGAARDAHLRAETLKIVIEADETMAELKRQVGALRTQADELVGRGEFGEAHAFLTAEREKVLLAAGATSPLRGMLAKVIDAVRTGAALRVARAESAIRQYIAQAMYDAARRELDPIKVEGVDDLAARVAAARAMIDGAEKAGLEAAAVKLRAEAARAYLELAGKVNAALGEFDCDEARTLLRTASYDRKLKVVRDWVREDLVHVGYVEDALPAAARGAASLKGSTHSFKMRGGAVRSGKVSRVIGNSIEIESRSPGGGVVSMRVPVEKLANAEVLSLVMRALDHGDPKTFLKAAIISALGGDLDAAKKNVAEAKKLGGDAASVERRWIALAEEIEARSLLSEARAHFKAKRYDEARKLLVTLKENFSHTKVYKEDYAPPR